ncbi:MAG: hypothetical protein ABWZ52_03160 [Acidimicrobiales bacterium]
MTAQQPTGGWRLLAPWTSPDGLTRWLNGTAWWGSSSLKSGPAMVVELLEAIAGRFTGQQLTLDVRGHRLTLVLDGVRVEGGEAPASDPLTWWLDLPAGREARRWSRAMTGRPAADEPPPPADIERVFISSSGLAIDDRPVGDVDATVDSVRLELGAVTELVTGRVDLEVRTTRRTVLDWINRSVTQWELRPAAGDLIVVRHDRWPGALLARPAAVTPRGVDVDIVGVRVLERDVRLPARFVRHRRYELPRLSDGLVVDAIDVDAEAVTVRLGHPGIRQPVRPEHLRTAVREGVARLGALAFPEPRARS